MSDPAAPVEREPDEGFLPKRPARAPVESIFVRFVATAGVVGVATAVAAILGSQDVHGWIIGLVVSLISVILAALLWRSRTL
jgi:protein-S-isoprenylcysteine O-methyltransferase Ste14